MLKPDTTVHTLQRRARLFRNGANQAIRIPREFELPGSEVRLIRDGNRLIVEPLNDQLGLLELLDSLKPLADEFPDVDETLVPLDDVRL